MRWTLVQAVARLFSWIIAGVFIWILTGCASISERTHAYLGSPRLPPTDPARVRILPGEPPEPKDRLGQVMLSIAGNPSRETVEDKIRRGAARLGADAAFVTYDRMHVIPVVYAGRWGPVGMSEELRRALVAVAIKFK